VHWTNCRPPSLARSTPDCWGQEVEVLVEEKHKGRWKGRTRTNKLVFFEDDTRDWRGRLAPVEITWAGPWSMQGQHGRA